mgnify:CR=1 FL=1
MLECLPYEKTQSVPATQGFIGAGIAWSVGQRAWGLEHWSMHGEMFLSERWAGQTTVQKTASRTKVHYFEISVDMTEFSM